MKKPEDMDGVDVERETAMNPKLTGDKCRCTACNAYFGRSSTFADHRVGPMRDRRCLTDTEMRQRGWRVDASGFWRREKIEWPS